MERKWKLYATGTKPKQPTYNEIVTSRVCFYFQKYKPFKGVKYVTKAGKFQVRT